MELVVFWTFQEAFTSDLLYMQFLNSKDRIQRGKWLFP